MAGEWTIPARRSVARRPYFMGLPHGYAALLICCCLELGAILDYPILALYLFAVGWVAGKAMVWFDPFAWELVLRSFSVPRRLRP